MLKFLPLINHKRSLGSLQTSHKPLIEKANNKSSNHAKSQNLPHLSLADPSPCVFFIVFLTGQAGRTQTGKEPAYLVAKMNSRKALLETTLDYDYGGANSKHDPKKGKPGIGGKP
ncbi:hypothetical protein MUK42_00032 [Musa troglodytarum]|uniref:Uncharacterized protein n=1 Tax=Musa troglodytarum TaxID=320322 RepID=A0A9E7FUW9_9LILI|nr:hypothetical protein MUK42_00032 [Musa troglodytarum]